MKGRGRDIESDSGKERFKNRGKFWQIKREIDDRVIEWIKQRVWESSRERLTVEQVSCLKRQIYQVVIEAEKESERERKNVCARERER